MDLKRILTSVIGLPLVVIILIVGNVYIMDMVLLAIAVICMKEYLGVVEKVSHPLKWIAYISTIMVFIVAFLSKEMSMTIVAFSIPILLLILFLKVIITDMETTFKDVAYTFLGICYVTFCIMFLSLIRGLEYGKILLGFTIIIAWATDIFAYLIGKKFGKHNFSKISPKKSIEGCIAGICGAMIFALMYTFVINIIIGNDILCLITGTQMPFIGATYLFVGFSAIIFSVISQIGDFIASSIKRFSDTKDYGNLLPGHGGMLDRVDSLIFIAPFVFMLFNIII